MARLLFSICHICIWEPFKDSKSADKSLLLSLVVTSDHLQYRPVEDSSIHLQFQARSLAFKVQWQELSGVAEKLRRRTSSSPLLKRRGLEDEEKMKPPPPCFFFMWLYDIDLFDHSCLEVITSSPCMHHVIMQNITFISSLHLSSIHTSFRNELD